MLKRTNVLNSHLLTIIYQDTISILKHILPKLLFKKFNLLLRSQILKARLNTCH